MVIENGTYLMNYMAYIDLNPVRSNLVFNPDDYKFASITRIKEALEKENSIIKPKPGIAARLSRSMRSTS